jgi:DNA primase
MSDSHFSDTAALLAGVSVADLLSANGVRLPARGTRVKCPFCEGSSQCFSYNEAKGCWHCFRCGEGGGKVRLIARLHNCTPKQALEWIAKLAGIELQKWNKLDQQKHAAAMQQAEKQGRHLVAWRDRIIFELREKRDLLQYVYWWAIRIGAHEDETALWVDICDYDRRIQWHQEAPWAWLADVFEQQQQRRAA